MVNNFNGDFMKHYKHSYAELAKIGRRYYGDTNFCSVLAVAVVADISYGKAFHAYKREGRRTRTGTHVYTQQRVLKGFKLTSKLDCDKTAIYQRKTLNNVFKDCKRWTGRYLIYVSGHVLAIRDGVCEDWTAEGSRRKVISIYKVS
jgi:hypothetical protein